ncbi:MAG: hypothetical protein OSB19_16925 [Opitutaceae bacterium]|jgi:hypothetical protein|nr:hypothetical protein [Opitutaceae bacterium]
MSENQPTDPTLEKEKSEDADASKKQLSRDSSKKRSFDTFYLFCVFLLVLAIGTQIVAIAIYS